MASITVTTPRDSHSDSTLISLRERSNETADRSKSARSRRMSPWTRVASSTATRISTIRSSRLEASSPTGALRSAKYRSSLLAEDGPLAGSTVSTPPELRNAKGLGAVAVRVAPSARIGRNRHGSAEVRRQEVRYTAAVPSHSLGWVRMLLS